MRRRQFLIGGPAVVGCHALRYRPQAPPLDEHELDTIAAIADTFLPRGDGMPGAHEANALATIVDPAYGVAPYLSELVGDLDQWCLVTALHVFLGLGPRGRERALEQRMGLVRGVPASLYRPAYEAVLALAKLAYFGGLHHAYGPAFAAFPGPSAGYAAGTAAGAWASTSPLTDAGHALRPGTSSEIVIGGVGTTSRVRLIAFVTSETVRATLRLHAPDRRHHDVAIAGRGDVHVDAEPPLVGGPAEGAWRLEVRAASGIARLASWSLIVRTTLDDGATP